MNLNIKGTQLDLTPAIRVYIEDKIGSLEKFIERIDAKDAVAVRVEISRTTKHHRKGPVFRAECNLRLPGKLLRAEHVDWDVRRCVDEIKKELQQQLKKYLSRVRPQDSKNIKKLRMLRGK